MCSARGSGRRLGCSSGWCPAEQVRLDGFSGSEAGPTGVRWAVDDGAVAELQAQVVRVAVDLHAGAVAFVVVMGAPHREQIEVGGTTKDPVVEVIDLTPRGRMGAARPPATAIADHERPVLVGGRAPYAAARS